jgi:hypothetical protein
MGSARCPPDATFGPALILGAEAGDERRSSIRSTITLERWERFDRHRLAGREYRR